MLDSISIKNYKGIQSENGLTLSELKNVNYLVGKNGCGKSSVLEGLQLHLVKAYKFNVNNLSIYAVIDKDENMKRIIEKDRVCVIDKLLPVEQRKDCIAKTIASNFIMISNFDELEQLYDIDKVNEFLKLNNYPEWNKEKDKKFAVDYCGNSFDKQFKSGELKLVLAEYMKSYTTKKDIKTLCPELHDLIFD